MSNLLNKPERWRKPAEEARAIADGMRDAEAKRLMLSVASSYEELGQRTETHRAGRQPELGRN